MMELGSEVQLHPLETYWMSLGAPQLEPKARESPHSNQYTESDFFRLGPFGLHLETPNASLRTK